MPASSHTPVSREALERFLQSSVSQRFPGRRLLAWRRRVTAYSSSCVITRVKAQLSNPRHELDLAFKNLSPDSLLPTARRIRPTFLYQPDREILVYQNILRHLSLDTPDYYHAEISPQPGKVWLLLEWVRGPLLWQLGRIQHWEEAARWLATFHRQARRLEQVDTLAKSIGLVQHTATTYTLWLERAETFLAHTLLRRDRTLARRFSRMSRQYEKVIHHLTQAPTAVLHGEFYPANIVMRRTDTGHRVCPIDWELASWGPKVLDLAALTLGNWSSEDQECMVRAYHSAFRRDALSNHSLSELLESVTFAQLHLCLRQLGWASRWKPPGQQSRQWLSTALKLADQLGL